QRALPVFASKTFRRQQRAHSTRTGQDAARPPVLLWTDTFNDHFHPEVLSAAHEVLEAAGFNVVISQAQLCCGRPLYDFGMLDLAKHMLRRTMTALRSELEAGVPIVVLEPSCASVFRDELPNLFPDDALAQKLKSQTYLLAEFLHRE